MDDRWGLDRRPTTEDMVREIRDLRAEIEKMRPMRKFYESGRAIGKAGIVLLGVGASAAAIWASFVDIMGRK